MLTVKELIEDYIFEGYEEYTKQERDVFRMLACTDCDKLIGCDFVSEEIEHFCDIYAEKIIKLLDNQ